MVVPYHKKLSERRIPIHYVIPLSCSNQWQSQNEDVMLQVGLDRGSTESSHLITIPLFLSLDLAA